MYNKNKKLPTFYLISTLSIVMSLLISTRSQASHKNFFFGDRVKRNQFRQLILDDKPSLDDKWSSLAAIKKLLEKRPQFVNIKDGCNNTPLHWAIKQGRDDVARLLIEKKADIGVQNIAGKTPLSCALEKGNVAITKLLINERTHVNKTDALNKPPLLPSPPPQFQTTREAALDSTPSESQLSLSLKRLKLQTELARRHNSTTTHIKPRPTRYKEIQTTASSRNTQINYVGATIGTLALLWYFFTKKRLPPLRKRIMIIKQYAT